MAVLRIREAEPLEGFKLRLTLTGGSIIAREVSRLETSNGPGALFAKVRVESGTVVWPNGADLCRDVLI
jgi:hypothetical protein